MSYNLKCCSFYPNNFDASALSVGVRMYFGRGTMTIRFISENNTVHFREQNDSFNGTKKPRAAYNNC